ncbi:MAG: hypothetical protein EOO73_05455 [Myxococcales bacterium]|nr:MAG: hypothetical protein EOO73_05455 [Myxococcales bacterium]
MKYGSSVRFLGFTLLLVGCSDTPKGAEPCDPSRGVLCTIIGTGDNGYSGDEGPAREARLSLPQDTLTSPEGTIYLLDWNNHRIRSITADGVIHHVAGRGELASAPDDPASEDFNHPTGLVLSADGQRLIVAAWHNSMIREIDLESGKVSNTCGDGRRAYFGDDGPAATASLDLPASVALSPDNDLVIMDQANQAIRYVDPDGNIHLLAGRCVVDRAPPEGPGPCAEGAEPVLCPGERAGKLTCGVPEATCGKPCTPGYAGDGAAAQELRMAQPFGQSADPAGRLLFDRDGNLLFADTANHVVRKLTADGTVERVAGVAPVEGTPQFGFSGDGGPALEAKLFNPVDLALDDQDNLYISDVYNHCVRAVSAKGVIRTVVGQCGHPGYEGDGGSPLDALLKRPYGIEWANGRLLVADTGNNVVRAVELP